MNMHRALYDCVRRLCIHEIQQDLNDFITGGAKNRGTQNLFRCRIDRDFDEPLCLSFLDGAAYPIHWKFRNERGAPGLSYLGVRHPASAQRRIREYSVRLDSILYPPMIAVEEVVGDDLMVVV